MKQIVFKSSLFILLIFAALFSFVAPSQSGSKNPNGMVYGQAKGKDRARDFYVVFSGGNIEKGTKGKICWIGKCKKAKAQSYAGSGVVIDAFYNNVGPYRCGAKTKVTLIYKGKNYTERTLINCGK